MCESLALQHIRRSEIQRTLFSLSFPCVSSIHDMYEDSEIENGSTDPLIVYCSESCERSLPLFNVYLFVIRRSHETER